MMTVRAKPPPSLHVASTGGACRARLLGFLAPWTARDNAYEIRVGSVRLSAEILSDDALEDRAARVGNDLWSHRRRVRLNRPAFVAAILEAGVTHAA